MHFLYSSFFITCRKKLRSYQERLPYQGEILEIAFPQGTQIDPKDRKPGTEDKVTADYPRTV